MLMTIVCKYCGKQTEKNVFPSSIPLFCSKSCCVSYNNVNRTILDKKELKKCLICEKLFEEYKSIDKKFCSRLCMGIGQRGKNNPFYGKQHTKESIKKMSDSQRGKVSHMLGKHHSEESKIKMSKSHKGVPSAMKGKHHTEEARKKMGVKKGMFSGEKNPNYGKHFSKKIRDKISKSNKKRYLEKCKQLGIKPNTYRERPKKFERWARQIKIKDGFTCQLCHETGGKLRSHHIKAWVDYPNDRYNIKNGITLCKECHDYVHKTNGEVQQ